jgi:hypothetical protein
MSHIELQLQMDVFNELEEEGKIQRTRSSILPNEKYSKVVLYLLQFFV